MSILSTVRRGLANDAKALTTIIRRSGPNPVLADQGQSWWLGRRGRLNRHIDEEIALTLTAVYRAVAIIASTIAGLPLHIERENQFGETSRDENPSNAYLWYRPNPEMTRPFFWETVIAHEVLNGNAYLFVVKNVAGQPLELWPIHPWDIRVERRGGQKVYFYKTEPFARIDYAQGGEIVHIPNMSRDGLVGLSPIMLAAQSIELAANAEEYGAHFFNEDAVPPGILSTDQPITRDQAIALRDDWQAQHGGTNREIAVLGNGAHFQAIAINPEDAQLLEERRFQIAEVARIFGIPPHMLGDMERSTSWGSGLEEQGRNFLTFTLQSHITRFESAIEDALLNRKETKRKVRFVTEGLLRANYQVRMQGHATAHGRFMTANEIRKLEGLPPIEGGDVLLQMTNLAPAEQLEEMNMAPEPAIPGGLPA